ncbi:hypothetical protein [Microbacterium sp. TNHR37B]|uniref:hypothetical protein n=1 Tax=Microbacterium sp. TNHR37B TaxID=1775956 RepID=UPI0007B22D9B|nr:hypothetical protein [Microbacterium sp. TNHR37B]KZE88897.1 hypothetical protein AVP41_01687 [Microbacterium sp. TNHR37B]
MTGSLRALAVAAAAISLVACAPTLAPDASPTAASSTPAAADPTPSAEPAIAPTVPLNGDCGSVLSAAQLDELLGEGWKTRDERVLEWVPNSPILPSAGGLETMGGLDCHWMIGGDFSSGSPWDLGVVIVPADHAEHPSVSDLAEMHCDPAYDTTVCRLGRVIGDVWVVVRSAVPGDELDSAAFLPEALDAVETSIGDGVEAAALPPGDGWWTMPECADLAERVRLEGFLGEGYRSGYWEGNPSREQLMLADAGAQLTCPWFTGEAGGAPDGTFYIVSLDLAPGAAWRWDGIAAAQGASTASVPGADAAVAFDLGDGNAAVFATDGVNVLEVVGVPQEMALTLAERALSAMG